MPLLLNVVQKNTWLQGQFVCVRDSGVALMLCLVCPFSLSANWAPQHPPVT